MCYFSRSIIKKQKRQIFIAVLVVIILLFLWGEISVDLNHWSYQKENALGFFIAHHPIEIFNEGILSTMIIIMFWEKLKG